MHSIGPGGQLLLLLLLLLLPLLLLLLLHYPLAQDARLRETRSSGAELRQRRAAPLGRGFLPGYPAFSRLAARFDTSAGKTTPTCSMQVASGHFTRLCAPVTPFLAPHRLADNRLLRTRIATAGGRSLLVTDCMAWS